MGEKQKIFVLDTNVILHDHQAIDAFADNNIVLPITVLEELDRFKRGNDQIHFQAREFMRKLDKLIGDTLTEEGVKLEHAKGRLYILPVKPFSESMQRSFPEDKNDHRIISVAEYLQRENSGKEVILVSKDINIRMKTKALGLKAQDYQTGKVDITSFFHNIKTFENQPGDAISHLYASKQENVQASEFRFDEELKHNEYMILKSADNKNALAYYNKHEDTIKQVSKHTAYGITPRNAEQAFAMHACLNKDVQLVSLTGKAGTGKTLIALAAALSIYREFDQIFLARPIVPLANKEVGFLPGDAQDKISPYMHPLFDNLSVIKHNFPEKSMGRETIENLQKEQKLLIQPLAFIRGRSLNNVFFIVDEAQNLTPHEVKTIVTRAGQNTKLVFTGDFQQIDSPYLDSRSNGLSYLTHKMEGQDLFAHVHLVKGERSELAELASNLL